MKRFFLALTLVLVLLGGFRPAPATAAPAAVASAVLASLQAGEPVRVIVMLRTDTAADSSAQTAAQAVARLHTTQDSLLAALPEGSFTLSHRFDYTPAVAGVLTSAGLDALVRSPAVAQILPDEPTTAHLTQAVPFIKADLVHDNLGITGQGVTVAVLDTGVDSDHPDLVDDLVAQKCYSLAKCPPEYTATESNSAEDGNGHGTNVAGIITGKGQVASPGFAPDAGLVAVRVLDQNGSGWMSDWVKGLEWVYANRTTLNISIVNMSLGTSTLYPGNCDGAQSTPVAILRQLYEAGITVFASSGNSASNGSMSSPACNSYTIAVGAVYDANISGTIKWGPSGTTCSDTDPTAGKLTCFTNRNSQLDVLAPGAMIFGPDVGGGVDTYGGTSQASPAAAGVAALMRQMNGNLAPAQILASLKNTGVPLFDSKSGLTFPRIDAEAAVNASVGIAVTVGGSGWGLLNQPVTLQSVSGPVHPAAGTVTYEWSGDFGAPIVHTLPYNQPDSVNLTFTSLGQKTVTLKATAGGMQSFDTYILKVYTPLVANFSASPRMQLKQTIVSFTNASTGEEASCIWNLGDGTPDVTNCAPFNHLYNPGLYSVALSITNPTGGASLVQRRYIGIGTNTAVTTTIPPAGLPLNVYPGIDLLIPAAGIAILPGASPAPQGPDPQGNLVMMPRPLDMANAPPPDQEHLFTFDLWPYDFEFTKPYTLTITVPQLNPHRYVGESLGLFAWDADAAAWTSVPGTYINGTVTAVISTTHTTTVTWGLLLPIEPRLFLPHTRR